MSASVPIVVHELVEAANSVHDAAKAMKNCKDNARKISKVALEIATSVENSATTALHRDDAIQPSISVTAALGATRDVFAQCASFMRDVAGRGPFSRHFKKGLTTDTIGGYLAAVEGLRGLLKVQNHACGFMLEPFDGLGIDETRSKTVLDANIRTIDAAYDGLKSTLNVMVNITDGLPWPLKAAPQTFLYILQLFEECQDIRPKISSLLYGVQNLWNTVGRVSKNASEGNLLRHMSGFFETLQRIAVRLHIVLRVGQVKRAMAIHTVRACLDLEQGRLNDARENIMLLFQAEIVTGIFEIKGKVGQTADPTVSPLISDVSVSATLPAKPIVFHGRDEFVKDSVQLLTTSGAGRIAILGSGGMGKTTVALALLHEPRIMAWFGSGRLFLSCEALVGADDIIVSLAKLLDLPASKDLLTAVVTRLASIPSVLLVLDNLETVWLVDGAPVSAIEELLGQLAQITSLSLIITCRGIVLPQFVDWSNADTAALEPFSLDAALDTLKDRAGRPFTGEDEDTARQLVNAVDRMPIAVSLLGQLLRRGNTVSELLNRWNREHSALLRTHGVGRINNVEVSIMLSIKMLCAGDDSQESLRLLSLCSMLPDGLRPAVFEKLRPQFKNIDRAKDNLIAYALASLDVDRVLKMLSPVRHLVLERYPSESNHRDALHSIYFDIANSLPVAVDEEFKHLAAVAAPEMGNLSFFLLGLVDRPSQQIVDAVDNFTSFSCFQQPTVTVASTLLLYLDPYPEWKARCLMTIGHLQNIIGEYKSSIQSLATALHLFLEVGNRSSAARCKRLTGDAYRLLGEYDHAETVLNESRAVYAELGEGLQVARCRLTLGSLMYSKGDFAASIDHLSAARQTFSSLGCTSYASRCTDFLGTVYLFQGSLESAIVEFETARSAHISLGNQAALAHNSLYLSQVRRQQNNLTLAEQLLKVAEAIHKETGDRFGLADCAREFGHVRWAMGRQEEAIAHFNIALGLYETLQIKHPAEECRNWVRHLEFTLSHASDDSQ